MKLYGKSNNEQLWTQLTFSSTRNNKKYFDVKCSNITNKSGNYNIIGIFDKPINSSLVYWSSKSNNIYDNPKNAYENTDNKGTINVVNGRFNININYPSPYFINGKLLNPHIHFKLCDSDKVFTVHLYKSNTIQDIIVIISILFLFYLLFIIYLKIIKKLILKKI